MKYRLTLLKKSQDLLLRVTAFDDGWACDSDVPIITTQILEDFTPKEYFFALLETLFDDAASKAQEASFAFRWPFTESICGEVISRINTLCSPERYGRTAHDYTDLIGKTPLLQLGKLADGCGATILVKLESMEPNSVKDRPVYSILSEAVNRGDINEGTEVVEASSGNVAIAIASILEVLMNKKPKIFISRMHGETKANAVRITGTPVVMTAKEGGTSSAKKASIQYAKDHENTFEVNQHSNPDNPLAHRLTTGPELYHQCHLLTGQAPAEFVTGLGSGGTGVGVALFREDIGADFKVVGVEPAEASLLTGGTFTPHKFSGIASGWITDILAENRDLIDHIEPILWEEGAEVCRRMFIEEGLLVGASSGASIAAAIRRAKLPENQGKVIVTIAHDRGDRYMGIEDLFVPSPQATIEDAEENPAN